jgi:hypothetical protein
MYRIPLRPMMHFIFIPPRIERPRSRGLPVGEGRKSLPTSPAEAVAPLQTHRATFS